MNKMTLAFAMAKYDHEDAVLRTIAQEALTFLIKNIHTNRMRSILLTGSVANGEGTVIQYNSSLVTSDFDFLVYLDAAYYLKNRTHLRNLSQVVSTRLMERGTDAHIEFLPFTNVLRADIYLTNSSIYEYEFALASRCVFGNTPSFNKAARPSKRDALELIFTVISELAFSNFKNVSKIEWSYILAKRALTVLNSILIFHGVFVRTYEKRIKIAKEYGSRQIIPLSRDEIETLEIFTEYKLSGSLQQLLDSLACNNIDGLIRFQREFLRKLTTKILYYELSSILKKTTRTRSGDIDSLQNMTNKFPILLKEYSRYSRTRLLSRIVAITLYLVWSLARNKKRKELFATFIFHKQSPKVILNVLTALLFIYGDYIDARKIIEEIFPWINLSGESETIQRIFSLWQIAEQSIKL